MIHVCFVCLGNICRSPTAEAILKKKLFEHKLQEHVRVCSRGLGGWHTGESPDIRSVEAGAKRGYHLNSRAQKMSEEDFKADYILAMDKSNYAALQAMAPHEQAREKIAMFRSFDSTAFTNQDVPDPYRGGEQGFEEVLDMCERAAEGLLEDIRLRLTDLNP